MSDIRFIQAQGDLLDTAITEASPKRAPATVMTRLRLWVRPHRRLAAVLLALVVAGCAAVASTSLSGSVQRLALGRVNCYYGTTMRGRFGYQHSDALVYGATLVNGETPQSWCKQAFSSYSTHELNEIGVTPVHDPKLIACRKNTTTIAVLIASGNPDQCQHLRLSPLPETFNAATKSVHSLATALRAMYFSRNCWPPHAFVSAVHATLVAHGYTDWRIVVPHINLSVDPPPAGTVPRCAVFVYPNPYVGNPYQSLNGPTRTFNFGLGMSRSDYERWNRLLDQLTAETWKQCYKPAAARKLIESTFAGTGLAPRLAITRPTNPDYRFTVPPRGVPVPSRGFRAAQRAKERHFLSGCVIQPMLWIASDDRFVDVWLTVHNGRWIKFGTYPPPNSYFHSL